MAGTDVHFGMCFTTVRSSWGPAVVRAIAPGSTYATSFDSGFGFPSILTRLLYILADQDELATTGRQTAGEVISGLIRLDFIDHIRNKVLNP